MQHLHLLNKSNQVLNSKSARDKLYKAVQYSIKVIVETSKRNKWTLTHVDKLEKAVKRLGQARSLFRYVMICHAGYTFGQKKTKTKTLSALQPF